MQKQMGFMAVLQLLYPPPWKGTAFRGCGKTQFLVIPIPQSGRGIPVVSRTYGVPPINPESAYRDSSPRLRSGQAKNALLLGMTMQHDHKTHVFPQSWVFPQPLSAVR